MVNLIYRNFNRSIEQDNAIVSNHYGVCSSKKLCFQNT
ncbi:hypothetical protein BTN49_1317 [Candidatus Enterovibrio escicola]|uniref:Uncharacterized protein n=1 Tax=Candidatus Enterovibrio escicola TaxID=1927127 RepID=A0A2A5T5D5_9GAMM|nr:hypothetical protein BTN49_1317 [Candidatus Enterovibrio escacola]